VQAVDSVMLEPRPRPFLQWKDLQNNGALDSVGSMFGMTSVLFRSSLRNADGKLRASTLEDQTYNAVESDPAWRRVLLLSVLGHSLLHHFG
jgi:hypothetical protein